MSHLQIAASKFSNGNACIVQLKNTQTNVGGGGGGGGGSAEMSHLQNCSDNIIKEH